MKKVIFDTDGGGDDLWALLLLIDAHQSGQIELMGVTTCFGNTSLDNASNNILNFLYHCGISDIPVFKGAMRTLNSLRGLADGAFGTDGLSEGKLPQSDQSFSTISAHDFLCATLKSSKTPISIISTGPATNIAGAFKSNPNFDRNNVEILWMGGAVLPSGGDHYPITREDGTLNRGNITPHMEFNAGNDVPAIQIITSLKNTRVTISSMDAGQNMDFAPKYQDILKQKMSDIGKGDIADNLIAFLQNVIALDQMKQGMKGTPIYDAQTVQKFLCDLDGTASDIFPKPIPLKSVTVIDKSELVPAFLAASDAGEFAPELLDTHGKMSIEAMPNDQTSNIQFIPGLYSIDETIREDNIPAAAKMGNKRAHDLINRVTKASQKIIFT